jgi:hypothetical protein
MPTEVSTQDLSGRFEMLPIAQSVFFSRSEHPDSPPPRSRLSLESANRVV